MPRETSVSSTTLRELPIRIRWAGWESDTYTLKNCGWEILAEQRMLDYAFAHEMRIACIDPEKKMAISGALRISPEYYQYGGRSLADLLYHSEGMELKSYQATDRVVQYTMSPGEVASLNRLRPTDGFAYVPLPEHSSVYSSMSFADLNLFKYDTSAPNEIYVSKASEGELLDRILQLQHPKQAEIKNGLWKPEARPIIQARVFSLAA
jgi:hypothetical protein